MLGSIGRFYRETALVKLIALGLLIGIAIALFVPSLTAVFSIFGVVFVNALKSIAPILVFVLVMNTMAQKRTDSNSKVKPIINLYLLSTFSASLLAVALSFAFPSTLTLSKSVAEIAAPGGIGEVINNLIVRVVDNPIHALSEANYISILTWSLLAGLAFQKASPATKSVLDDLAKDMTQIVKWVIMFAPFGIMGLVTAAIGENGLGILLNYAQLLSVLLTAFFCMALVINPLLVYIYIRRNPYPLVMTTLRESGMYAFFTRSSAANIPVNLSLCKRLGLNEDTYSISIPLGATINTCGAAITIAILSLATAHTLGVKVDIPTALLFSAVATVGACGASGVAGGSLLLVPVACSSFGIGNDISMQVVGIGFIIGVIQDSCETALNSSSDVLFTAAAEFAERAKTGTLTADDLHPRIG